MAGKALTVLAIVVIVGAAIGVYLIKHTPTALTDEDAVRAVVTEFGTKLQQVSIRAPREQAAQSIQENYAPYVTSALLTRWMNDPSLSPGRETSSPWPDRIDIASVTMKSATQYEVLGNVIEVTNEATGIGETPTEAARRPVTLSVDKTGDAWRISAVTLGAYPGNGNWIYSSTTAQGFQFMYPEKLMTTFISAQEWPASTSDGSPTRGWPPLIEKTANAYSCKEGPITAADGPMKEAKKHMVGDREYCVVTESEGAAGSTYTTYDYTTKYANATYRAVFTLRFPQCLNYDEPNQSACKAEQASFDIDGLVDRMIQSIRMQ